jgi:hypothetical protein
MPASRRTRLAAAIRRHPKFREEKDLRCPRTVTANGTPLDLWVTESRDSTGEVIRKLLVTPRSGTKPTAAISLYESGIAVEGQRGRAFLAKEGKQTLVLRQIETVQSSDFTLYRLTGRGSAKLLSRMDTSSYEAPVVEVHPSIRDGRLRLRLLVFEPGVVPGLADRHPRLVNSDGHVKQIDLLEIQRGSLKKVASAP